MAKVKLKKHPEYEDNFMPTRGSEGAAGWDLVAGKDMELNPFHPTLVPTFFDVEIPPEHMMLILPRSGRSLKDAMIVANSPGLIDEDYRGHLQIICTWIPSDETYRQMGVLKIEKGTKIAQAVLVKYEPQEWEAVNALSSTGRGRGGFGSTDSGSKT